MKTIPFLAFGGVVLLISSVVFLPGCSAVKVSYVNEDDRSEGVHFYEPRPYLLITKGEAKEGKAALLSQIVWLPDTSRRCKAEFKSGWGSMNGSIKLVNGWMLETLGAQTDSKIPETISAVGGLVMAAAKRGMSTNELSKEGLYLIVIKTNGTVEFHKTGDLVITD